MNPTRNLHFWISMLLLIAGLHSYGQNLVPNCEFELTNGCPTGQGQINRAKYWKTPGGTSDYCHACNSGNFSVPYNQWGNQAALSGSGYAHIISYYPSQGNFSEYIYTQLACPLQAGQSYEVSFYVSCSEDSHFAIDGIGAFLSVSAPIQTDNDFIDIGTQVYVSTPQGHVLDDKNGWEKVYGTYIANGGEKYITIGNFLPVSELTIVPFASWNTSIASYYIENVSVIGTTSLIDLGPDTTICPNDTVILDISGICNISALTWEDGSNDTIRKVGPGTYSISGEIGCSNFYEDITISSTPDPGTFLPADTVRCNGMSIDIIPTQTFDAYQWQDGSDQPIYTSNVDGLFWLEATDQYGCIFYDSVDVGNLNAPSFFLGYDTLMCMGSEVILNPGLDSNYNHFTWSDYSSDLILAVSDSGEYWLHVSNPCGEMSDTIFISTYNCDPAIAAPNAFTPNGDGLNDRFELKAENITNFNMYIYDRWGTLIFESKDLQYGWDGTFNGNACSGGAYVWLAMYEIYIDNGELKQEKVNGTVVLLR